MLRRRLGPRGALGLILTLAATGASTAPASAGSNPARPTSKPALHQHLRVRTSDPAIRLERSLPARPARAPNAVVGGSWASLGPAPIANEKNIGGNAQTTSDYGRASGRLTSVVTDPSNSSIIYVGASGGGVWKSLDGGASWSTTTDSQPSLAIGSLAIDAAGTTVYAGTGEDNASGDSQLGQGILKSTDLGKTWAVVGPSVLAGLRIGGMVVDRATSGSTERVFAATSGGLLVSKDSGSSWAQVVLPATPLPGSTASQHVMQVLQDSTGRFWASVSDFCQTEQGDVMTSPDGTTWSVSYGAPSPGSGRIGLGIGSNGASAYAALASCTNFGDLLGIQRSVDGGQTWRATATQPPAYFSFPNMTPLQSQGWYDNVVAVDPTNGANAIFGGVTLVATDDGGSHFTDIGRSYLGGVIHVDYHALTYTGAGTFYAGNDGGIWQGSETLGTTSVAAIFTNLNANLDTIQFYQGAALDMNHVLGGSQDNGSPGIFPGSPAVAPAWQEYLDGDGNYSAIDPTPGSTVIYASSADGGIFKGSYAPTGSANWPYDTFVEADPCPFGSALAVCHDPVAFTAPFLMDQTNPSRLLAATDKVYQSTSAGVPAGSSWSAISPVLATATAPAGAVDVIASMTLGPTSASAATVVTGSYFGAVWISRNATSASATWTNITGNLPAFNLLNHIPGDPWISGVAVNPTNTLELWVTIGAVGLGHVWHTTNGGSSWSDISGAGATGVPAAVVNAIILERSNTTIDIATDFGVMTCSTCAGSTPVATWSTLGSGLPNVKVSGLTQAADGSGIYAWTHGRGAWVLGQPLRVSPTSLNFQVGEGGSKPGSQPVTVTNHGTGTLNWAQTSNSSWLSATPPSGSDAPNASSTVTVSVNPTGVKAGTYQGQIAFTSNGGSASVNVTLIVPPFPGPYRPVVPSRILDTRDGTGGYSFPLGPNQVIGIQVAGQGGVPLMTSSTPPAAVVLNVTVTNPNAPSFLTVYPTGVPRPTASNLNFLRGQTVPNLVEVALGSDGNVNAYNAAGTTDVIFDVEGWVASQGTVTGTAGLYRPLVPARILDTRNGTGGFSTPVGPNQTIHLQVAGQGGLPGWTSPNPPEGIVLNVTETNPTAPSFLTVYPTGVGRPVASNLNFTAGRTVPNRVAVPLGTSGQVDIYNAAGSVDVIVDVNGWFTNGSDPTATGGAFSGLTPARILDTRSGTGGFPGPLGPGGSISLPVAGHGGVPPMSAAVPPTAVVLNVTVTNATSPSFLTVYPSDAPQRPVASDLNYVAGQTAPNLVVVRLAADGKVTIYNAAGSTDVIVDVSGWYN